jgi:hypothetical protein
MASSPSQVLIPDLDVTIDSHWFPHTRSNSSVANLIQSNPTAIEVARASETTMLPSEYTSLVGALLHQKQRYREEGIIHTNIILQK